MSLEIGGVTVPPIYPTQPAGGGETPPSGGEGETAPNVGAGDGGPDAVYEPSAPEDGEPLTYPNPYATTPSGNGDDGASSEGSGVTGDEGGDATAPVAPDANSGDPYVDESASGPADSGAVGGEDAVPPQDSAPEPVVSDGELADPPAEPEPVEDASGGAEPSGDTNGADGVLPEQGAVDPPVQDDGGDSTADPAVEDGASAEDYDNGPVNGDPADPAAGPPPPANDDGGAGQDGEGSPIAAAPVLQPAVATPVSVSTRPRKDMIEAAEIERPTLAAALGHAQPKRSLASQVSETIAPEAPSAVTPAQRQSTHVIQAPRAAATAAAPLLAASDTGAEAAEVAPPKVVAALVAQAAYGFVQTAQTRQASVLSLLKFG